MKAKIRIVIQAPPYTSLKPKDLEGLPPRDRVMTIMVLHQQANLAQMERMAEGLEPAQKGMPVSRKSSPMLAFIGCLEY